MSNTAIQDAHWVFDLFAAYRAHRHVEIFLAGENMLNERYVGRRVQSRAWGAASVFRGRARELLGNRAGAPMVSVATNQQEGLPCGKCFLLPSR
jgi:hypothetical protein